MPTYRYKAYNNAGRTVAGNIDATGTREAADRLKEGGLYPVEVVEAAHHRTLLARLTPAGVPPRVLALATRQIATLITTGTPLAEALGVVAENTADPRLRPAIRNVREQVTGGSSLASAMGAHPRIFSRFYRGLVASGEASGTLGPVLDRLAEYLESRARITSELWTAITYPILMVAVGAGVLSFLFVFVIPKITRIFEDSATALPWITVVLIAIADAISTFWPVAIILIGALILGAGRFRSSERVRAWADHILLKLPVAGPMAAGFFAASMARTLGSLLRGGVNLIKALEITREVVGNRDFGRVIDRAIEDCTGGGMLSESLKRSGVVSPITVHMIGVGERGGNLDEMLLTAATAAESEFESGLKRLISLAEPIMVLIMGVVIGLIVLAILLPIFELNQLVA